MTSVRVAVTVLCLTGALAGAQQRVGQAPSLPQRSAPALRPTSLFLPLAHARKFGDAEIVIQNNGPEAQPVGVTFFIEGREIPADPVDVDPLQSIVRPLSLLMPSGVTIANVDGLRLSFGGRAVDQIAAQVTLLPIGASQAKQALDVPLVVPMDFKGSTLDAVWATPRGDERLVLVLANRTSDPIRVHVVHPDSASTIALGPWKSQTLERGVSRNAQGADWVRLESDAGPASVAATGFAISASDWLPRLIRFVDASRTAGADLFGAGLRIAKASVALALRNVTDAPVTTVVQVLHPETGVVLTAWPLPAIAAQSARAVDLTSLPQRVTEVPVVNVRVVNSGPAGSLLGDLSSVDRSTGLLHSVPLRDVGNDGGTSRRGTGTAPWRIDGDYDTRLTIMNTGDAAAVFVLHQAYGEGKIKDTTRPVKLEPGASATFDVRAMRDSQSREGFTRAIDAGMERGLFNWSIQSPPSSKLTGRVEIVSVSRRVSSSVTW